jgi:hypothetical protein
MNEANVPNNADTVYLDSSKLDEIRENILIDIKSIVFSFKFGCTDRELKYEYRQLNNTEIPFRQLGYQTLNSFMRSIPNVDIKKNETGDLWVYHAVYDEKTEHIGIVHIIAICFVKVTQD